jgi:hypothetical protein
MMVSAGSQGVVAWCGVQSQHIMGVGKRRTNLVQVHHHRPSRSIKMNFTSTESSLPMDIWEDIFQAMHLSGDFVGLKRCSSLNYAFRATLSPLDLRLGPDHPTRDFAGRPALLHAHSATHHSSLYPNGRRLGVHDPFICSGCSSRERPRRAVNVHPHAIALYAQPHISGFG